MSESEDQGGAGRREVAYRLFAAEFEDADFSYSESDEERAPNYVVSPTGGRVNRLFVVGVLTEVENASEDVIRARIVDPTGAFVVYAGQYQPEAQAFFERADPPMFVAVTGKARTFQPDDADVTYTSIRPENVNEVDAETRDRWTVGTARQTLDRVRTMAHALQREERGDELRAALEAEGVDTGLAAGSPLAIDHYGTTPAYLDTVRNTAVQAIEVVAGERDEVDPHSASPDAPGEGDLATLAGLDVTANVGGESADLGGALDDSESMTAEATSESTAASTESEPEVTDSTATESEREETVAAGGDATDEVDTATEEVAAGGAPAGSEGGEAGADAGADDLDDFDPDEFELDDDEREEIEQEYGTDFESGSEVGEPGEAGIETPDSEELTEEAEADEAETESAAEETEAADEPAEDVDIEDAVMDAMREHDDGGAHAEEIVETVTARIGVDEPDVRDAIQDALMDGRCYEPDDDVYKPI
jgi:RPA family protein